MPVLSQNKKVDRQRLALGLAGVAGAVAVGQLAVTSANADSTSNSNQSSMNLAQGVTAGSFDLTKQASGNMQFPVQFDRPAGVNAAALAGTVIQLGSGSQLYQSASKAVPDLTNTTKMNTLLSDALDSSNPNYQSARQDIVGLINWYNSLQGVNKIETQNGSAYTVDNLDQPINQLAVAFSNNNSISSQATTALNAINNAKTVQDVQNALESFKSGVSQQYVDAFNAYAQKVYASGADLNSLSTYDQLKPVLQAYQNMYADGGAALRSILLNGQSASNEAGVTFFESAVIAGPTTTNGGSSNTQNTPSTTPAAVTYTTKYLDENGNQVGPDSTSTTGYDKQKDIPGYTFKSTSTDDKNHVQTFTYTKNAATPTTITYTTKYVDPNGNVISPDVTSTTGYGDKKDIPGYTFKGVTTDDKTHTQSFTYTKNPDATKPNTYWFDDSGNSLKAEAVGQTLPDTKGTDIAGYTLKYTHTVTADDIAKNGSLYGSSFGVGDVLNVYTKKVVYTTYVDDKGNTIAPKVEGTFPDTAGNKVPGYTLLATTTTADGDTVNTYKKNAATLTTIFVDPDGKQISPDVTGTSFADKKDINGYTFKSEAVSADGLTKTFTYTKNPDTKTLTTSFVDPNGNQISPDITGTSFADKKDVPGYIYTGETVSADGLHKSFQYTRALTTNFVDPDGNVISPAVTDKAFADKKDIPGYTYKGEVVSADGTQKTYTYTKNATAKTLTTSYTDPDGNTIYPDVTGTSFADKRDIPGYTFKGEVISPDGLHKTFTYTKNAVAKTLTTSFVDADGNVISPDVTGDSFADKKDIPGYDFVGETLSSDGLHKTYSYKKSAATPTTTDTTTPTTTDTPAVATPTATTPASTTAPAASTTPSSTGSQDLPNTGTANGASTVMTGVGASIMSALGLGGLYAKFRKRRHAK